MNEPTLICMVGISESGKSTKAKEIAKENGYRIVSTDDIREQFCKSISDQSRNHVVFQIFYSKICYALVNKENVIADATFLTRKERSALFQNVGNIPCKKKAYVMNKPFEQCLKDNESESRAFSVPVQVMLKQKDQFIMPSKDEGFDEIVIDDCLDQCKQSFAEKDYEK